MSEESKFKYSFNETRYRWLAEEVASIYADFDKGLFLDYVLEDLDSRELLQRLRRTTEGLRRTLPQDFPQALGVLRLLGPRLAQSFFGIVPCDFVGLYGHEHYELSMQAMAEFTCYGSGEFAIREFLRRQLHRTLEVMTQWSRDQNEHVRRLASEGSRPRLPWGCRLEELVKDPSPTLPLLENLKADPSLYVRKSVANHLNDISKDHPDYVLDLLERWGLKDPHCAWIAKHACRGLIKAGHPRALALFSFSAKTKLSVGKLKLSHKELRVGDSLEMRFRLESDSNKAQRLVVDYRVHYLKHNGQHSHKVFKWKEILLQPGEVLELRKKQHFKRISIRKYYQGKHMVEVQINGLCYSKAAFELLA